MPDTIITTVPTTENTPNTTIRRYIPTIILLSAGLVLWFLFSGLASRALTTTGTLLPLAQENTLTVEEGGRYDIYYEYRRAPEITSPVGLQFLLDGTDPVLSYSTSEKGDYRVLGSKGDLMARVNFPEAGDYSMQVAYGNEQITEKSVVRIVKGFIWKPLLYQLVAVASGGILVLIAAFLFFATVFQNKWEGYRLFHDMAFQTDEFSEDDLSYEETRVISLAEETGELSMSRKIIPFSTDALPLPETDSIVEKKTIQLTDIPKKVKNAYRKKESKVFTVRDFAETTNTAIEEISMNIENVEKTNGAT